MQETSVGGLVCVRCCCFTVVAFALTYPLLACGQAWQAPETRATLASMAAEAMNPMSPDEFAAHQDRERARFGALVRNANIRAN